jgi:phage-related protein
LSKAEFREIIAVLSRRIRIFLWDEPDKHYIGELFEETDVTVFPKEVNREFTLNFVCQPFAFGEQQVVHLTRGVNNVTYTGTAETPTLLVIRNPNSFAIANIHITGIARRHS